MWPKSVTVVQDGKPAELQVHELDLANTYVMNRGCGIGCCPHLFYRMGGSGELRYHGELFGDSPGAAGEHRLVVPAGAAELIVAELEDEITVVRSLDIDGSRILGGVMLATGEELRVEVEGGSRVRLAGYYECLTTSRPQPWRRNELIAAYLRRSRKSSCPGAFA
jgi:hypothetical protein